MKIAIALFGSKVSPRFDLSPEFWVIRVENRRVIHQETISTQRFDLSQRMEQLASSGVKKLICGGIHDFSMNQLSNMGIEVFYNVMGEAGMALKNFLNGELKSGFHFEKGKTGNINDHKMVVKTSGWKKGTRRRFCASEKNNP